MATDSRETPALRVQDITVCFGGMMALNGVSMEVRRGARHGILGPNGAGKTTLFNVVTGFVPPDRGRVMVRGVDVTRMAAHRRVALGLTRTFQITTLFPGLTALENVMMGTLRRIRHHRNLWRPAHQDQEARDLAMALLDDLQLAGFADAAVGEIGYGQQRQLEIAMALSSGPSILLLDEPTAGLSSAETQAVCGLVGRLPPELTLVIIEHDLDVIFGLASYITVLHQGNKIADGPAEAVQADPLVKEVYLGAR
jgi:branched-chain amino acid transport system ATP-binding protein